MLPLEWVVKEGTYDDCYIKWAPGVAGRVCPQFRFFKPEATRDNAWKNVSEERKAYKEGPAAYDAMLVREMTLIMEETELASMRDSGDLWPKFSNCFISMDGLFSHLPFFKMYLRTLFTSLRDEENVSHVELRLVPFTPYDMSDAEDRPPRTFDDAIAAVREVELEFQRRIDHPDKDYFSAKVIYCQLRHLSPDEMDKEIQCASSIRQTSPTLTGFDIIGTELPAEGRHSDLKDYMPAFKAYMAEMQPRNPLQFMFHVGQVYPPHVPEEALTNIETVLEEFITSAGTTKFLRRLSHCSVLPHHPRLDKILTTLCGTRGNEKPDVAVEIQPISNHILLGVPLKTWDGTPPTSKISHLPLLFEAGVPVIVGCDDPSIWGVPLGYLASWDWFVVFLLFWDLLGLDGIRKLLEDSILFSSGTDEQDRTWLRAVFGKKWTEWLDYVAQVAE